MLTAVANDEHLIISMSFDQVCACLDMYDYSLQTHVLNMEDLQWIRMMTIISKEIVAMSSHHHAQLHRLNPIFVVAIFFNISLFIYILLYPPGAVLHD